MLKLVNLLFQQLTLFFQPSDVLVVPSSFPLQFYNFGLDVLNLTILNRLLTFKLGQILNLFLKGFLFI